MEREKAAKLKEIRILGEFNQGHQQVQSISNNYRNQWVTPPKFNKRTPQLPDAEGGEKSLASDTQEYKRTTERDNIDAGSINDNSLLILPSSAISTFNISTESSDLGTGKWSNTFKKKNIVDQFQEQTADMKTRDYKLALHRKYEENIVSKLRDLEYENSLLKAQLAEVAAMKELEIGDLKKQLGKGEYELEKAEQAFSYANSELKQRVDSMHATILDRDLTIQKLKEYQDIQVVEICHLKKRNSQLEKYLADLPTADEFERTKQEISKFQPRYIINTCSLNFLIFFKAIFEAEVKSLKYRLSQNNGDSASSESIVNHTIAKEDENVDIKKFQLINKYLSEENERVKKFLQSKHQKLLEVLSDKQHNIEQYQHRLTEEKDIISGLSKSLKERDSTIKQLQMSIKTVSNQNQDILEQNIELQELCNKLKLNQLDTKVGKYQQIEKELTRCIKELSSIVQICIARTQGKDPNLSLLLGLEASNSSTRNQNIRGSEDDVEDNISKIRRLQLEISKLRDQVSEQYAEDIGKTCPVQ
ncbi:uncharacterized protein TRIADDRAFT_56407 [Trichoplax adhaerens]|uniref:Centrosomal protein of 85 kDa-like CC4 coiled-coil domain-containing protein n=1 Tax=Trichoplax adhaerens TaxID=10228 RepID=B3RY18_TRIAD|nr:hypothetical protein TRIADDRAFT_56407 [Trichoplax adhaerens]EDV24526.1 hypothetical protein TRIADDRAFT_56407 [Trichoplax adhaerens]|eukprot:XP_002112416.1 hypothetical protein TRIADDRAFT_56407 [Trichoplax adhaerens]